MENFGQIQLFRSRLLLSRSGITYDGKQVFVKVNVKESTDGAFITNNSINGGTSVRLSLLIYLSIVLNSPPIEKKMKKPIIEVYS
ncbi:MAG: hypothetical protein L3J83_05225 [Proteobacteria bacterium]|nr:hypothetical protein [Pseudomonadota bacterium]